jgi:molecular chaperone DnaK (HSP70)
VSKTAKQPEDAVYAVGVDLGTTNCALAATRLDVDPAAPAILDVLDVPQVINPGEVEPRPLLPSFLYLPHEQELPAKALALPWEAGRGFVVGGFARSQGARVPGRLVHSAKSWLAVTTDEGPHAAILPWQAPDGVSKVSPVEASTRYLTHLREAWDHAHQDAPLAAQELVLTVPASFDASARELTAEAARQTGLEKLTLLEEPQAAVYAWLAAHGDDWRKHLKAGDVLLVVDVGGGTTDLSLITVGEETGNLTLNRLAVGDHILLGGDNMDLALAYAIKTKLEAGGKTLDSSQMSALTFACRDAKEALFAKMDMKTHPIAIAGRGSSLMGSTVRTELDRELLMQVLVDGFFPKVSADARPLKTRRMGLATLGLPYAQDAAVTKHLAEFLGRQVNAAQAQPPVSPAMGASFIHPTCVLFNGGVFKAKALQDRVVEVLNGWLSREQAAAVRVLAGQDLDHAVAKGAAAYARYRAAGGLRIRGGTARAYYVGIELSAPAVPGVQPPVKAVCVAPFGMEEGTREEVGQDLGLVTGEPARFRFFASTVRRTDRVGAEVNEWKDDLVELPPIEATASGSQGELVPVRIRSHVTAIGTLELTCADRKGQERARFEFNARDAG